MAVTAPISGDQGQGRDVTVGLAATLRGPGERPVVVRETHMSWVLLTAGRAFELKKPVRFAFVDLSTPQLRRHACEEEVRVNRELAADVVLGIRALVLRGGAYVLADRPADAAVDWVVEMRRFDEDRTMAALLERGELSIDQVTAVGWPWPHSTGGTALRAGRGHAGGGARRAQPGRAAPAVRRARPDYPPARAASRQSSRRPGAA